MAMSRRSHGDLMATLSFLRSSMAFLRRSSWRLHALSLCSHGVSTACIELSRRAHCACTFVSIPCSNPKVNTHWGPPVSALASCHMLYVAEEHREWLAAIRPEISVRTLLITEGLLDKRGVIHLFMRNSKLKFSIDNRSLVDRNFKASSKLLRLSVRNGA